MEQATGFDSFRLVGGPQLARLFHPGQTVLSQRWSQSHWGKLPREETLRLKGPVLTLGCRRASGQVWRSLWLEEGTGMAGREWGRKCAVSDWWYRYPLLFKSSLYVTSLL